MKYPLIIFLVIILGIASFLAYRKKSARPEGSPSAMDQTVDVLTGVGALEKKIEVADPQLAVIQAKAIFRKLVTDGVDLSSGPCIAEDLMPDWVADIVHNPHEAIDDLPENQCASYRKGRARHFVELDLTGEVIRMQ